MKKLKLDLDQVKVDSFGMSGTEGQKGTVHGQTYTFPSGEECNTGRQDSCYSCPAPPWCAPEPISTYC
jgi:hypothetical protein